MTRPREAFVAILAEQAADGHLEIERGGCPGKMEAKMATLRKILLVDDDDDLREALSEQLVMTEDFDVFEARNGAEGMEKIKQGIYDLVVLDVGLPDTDGRELCKRMRKAGVKCPIMMLTGHDSDSDTILGLDSGANDYVTKPFKFPVLLARIRAQLRTHEQSEDAVFQLGPYTFKPAQKLLIDAKDKKFDYVSFTKAEPSRAWWRAMSCCMRSGGITPASPPIRWKPISTGCGKRSRQTRQTRAFWSPKAVVTNWWRDCRKVNGLGLIVA